VGGAAAVLWQWREAEAARAVAERVQQDLRQELWTSRLAEARANRWGGRAGRRFDSLEAIRQAAVIRPSLELRNEAVACLALPDVRVQRWVENRTELFGYALDEAFERYACAYQDASISLRRLRDRSEIMRFPARGRVEHSHLLFSHQGRFLSQRTTTKENVPSGVWDTSRGQLVLAPSFSVRSTCFTPDDKQVILAEAGGKIHFCDLATGAETGELTAPPVVNHVAVDPEGKRVAVSRESDPSVIVFDLATKTICASFTNAVGVGFMSWSPDGQVLACPSSDRLYLWNVATGERQILEGHRGVVTAALFNHQGDLLVSAGWDGMIRLWDPKLALHLVSLPGGWTQNGFDASDRRLAFGVSGHQNGVCEVSAARECRRLGRTAAVWSGAFSADGRVLATASSDGVRFWQVPMNRLLAHLPMPEARSVMWHPNGTNLITSGWPGIELWPIGLSANAIAVDLGPARQLASLPRERAGLAADGRFVVAVHSADAELVAIELDHPEQPRRFTGHANASSVSISPNGKWFATGTWHGTGVKVWSTDTWKPIQELRVTGNAVCSFTPDDRWLVTSSGEECCLWSADTWEPRWRLPRDRAGDMHGGIALSADPPMAALLHGRDRGLKLVSIPDGRELAFLDTGEPLCFSRDGSLLATTSEDHRNVLVWDLRLIRKELRALGLDWD
jgi:WD40 repeat protein